MKNYKKTVFRVFAIILLLLCLGGCFDRRELNTLGIVLGVALDKGEKEGQTEMTVQMADINGGQSGSSSKASKGSGSTEYVNMTNSGASINSILRRFEHKLSRKIYMPHNQVIIFSEEFAKQGVSDSLDFFARAPEARMTLYIFVAKGKAADVLDVEPEFENIPSSELSKILLDQRITSEAPIVTEFEFVSALISSTTSAVAPIVEIKEEKERKVLNVSGCIVFKGDKAVGELNNTQTRGYLMIMNKVKSEAIEVNLLGEKATVEIAKAECKVKPEIKEDGSVLYKIDVEATGSLGDQSGEINMAELENAKLLEKEAQLAIKREMEEAIKKATGMGTDIFGFGEMINRKYPRKWSKMKDKWDEDFKIIKYEIAVKMTVIGSGRIVAPLHPQEG